MITKILKTILFIVLALAALYLVRIGSMIILEFVRWLCGLFGAELTPAPMSQNDILNMFQ